MPRTYLRQIRFRMAYTEGRLETKGVTLSPARRIVSRHARGVGTPLQPIFPTRTMNLEVCCFPITRCSQVVPPVSSGLPQREASLSQVTQSGIPAVASIRERVP